MAREHRIGEVADIAIAVVEGEDDEAAPEIAFREAPVGLVERYDLIVGDADGSQQVVEEFRRDFEVQIRLEPVGARRTHMMEGQDRADAGHESRRNAMEPGGVNCVQAGYADLRRQFHPAARYRSTWRRTSRFTRALNASQW